MTQILEEAREAWSRQLEEEVRRIWPNVDPLVSGLTVLLSAALSSFAVRLLNLSWRGVSPRRPLHHAGERARHRPRV